MNAAIQHSIADDAVRGSTKVQQGDVVMPFYVIVDTSGSMEHDIPALEAGLAKLQQLIKDTPALDDVVHVAILEFDSEARVLVPLGALAEATIPSLSASGGTSYSNAIRTLRATIDQDVASLLAQGFRVFRSCAFWLTDGEPSSADTTWEQVFAEEFGYDDETKGGNKQYPRVIPIGFRDASLETLSKMAYPAKGGKAFVQRDGARIEDAFDAIIPFIGRTIVATGETASTSKVEHVFPEKLEGFDAQDSQYVGGDWMVQ